MSPVVLLVDDDDGCAILLRAAMEKAAIDCTLQYVSEGKEAMDYLNGVGKYQDRGKFPLPSLVLLDMKMPNIGGIDVLRWKSKQRSLDWLPVVVWSTADMEGDQQEAVALGANGYLQKPLKLQGLMDVARELIEIMTRHQGSFLMDGKTGEQPQKGQTGS